MADQSRVRRHLGPLWRTTFVEPVREGRLRLVGLGRLDLQLARAGLVAIALLLISLLAATTWRRGPMTTALSPDGTLFVPTGIVAVTVLCFALAWVLVVWGAFDGSAATRVGVAVLFAIINAVLVFKVADGLGQGSWSLRHGPRLVEASFYVPPAALLVSAALVPWPRVSRTAQPVLRGVAVAALAGLFLGLFWLHLTQLSTVNGSNLPSALSTVISQLGSATLPLIYVAAVAVADFALDVSTSLAEPVRGLRLRWIRLLLVGLVVVKLWFVVFARWNFWSVYVGAQPQTVLRTVLVTLMLGALVVAVTRFRRSDDTEEAEESLTYGAAFVVAAALLFQTTWAGLGVLIASVFGTESVEDASTHLPMDWLNTWGIAAAAAAAVLVGIWLMRRSKGGLGDEIGSGMIVIGSWNAVNLTLDNSRLQVGLSLPTLDLTLTLAVVAVAIVRWRRLDAAPGVTLASVLVFGWLVASQGDYISYLGALLGLPGAIVLVFGIVWTLASGSAFASGSSPRLPQASRALLYVGFLLLSVAILHWQETTHASGSGADQQVGYYFLAIPIAAWLLGRRVLARPKPHPAATGSEAARSAP